MVFSCNEICTTQKEGEGKGEGRIKKKRQQQQKYKQQHRKHSKILYWRKARPKRACAMYAIYRIIPFILNCGRGKATLPR